MKLNLITSIILIIILIASCKSKSPDPSAGIKDVDLIFKGKEIAMNAQAFLGKNLMAAIQSGGTEYAISFCSERAIELTDSVAQVSNAGIRRVSDKNRNPMNKASGSELQYIQDAKKALAASEVINPQLEVIENKTYGYYPILTNDLCIQCHGNKSTDITESTLAELNRLYPEDKATGYGVNELRGIWVVELDKIRK
ncbi:MAG: DUF3365 domain-containing protein [Saprospiraceae bacterium]|nr:DUF3365 domain-containing protein [Saprospiraceae bacterium]